MAPVTRSEVVRFFAIHLESENAYSSSSIACRKPTRLSTPISTRKLRKRNKPTFIATKYVENVIKLKQNFLNTLFQYFSNFLHVSPGYFSISHAFKTFENWLVSIDIWHFHWTINGIQNFFCSGTWESLTETNSFIRFYKKRLFSNLKIFIWNCATSCI